MIHFFGDVKSKIYVVQSKSSFSSIDYKKLNWLFDGAPFINSSTLSGIYLGPHASMISPWSTNAVEITQNMGILGIVRIEEFRAKRSVASFDPMLLSIYEELNQTVFESAIVPEDIRAIQDIEAYNQEEGLALNQEEIDYLHSLSKALNRPLTDSEVFGFSQVNSEHCRHKIFNGKFIIDGKEKESSLFQLIKKTAKLNPNSIVSAYKDNVAFMDGPKIKQFAPSTPTEASAYEEKEVDSIISLKAETHNFPTTVEPFNGAATGSGGEIRDRLAGGQGSLPYAGTAVYMTPYSRLAKNNPWEDSFPKRPWLYQTPKDLLIKASNGASDFGNKFGQPLINGSLLTFEHQEQKMQLGYDKVIMLAGGVGAGIKDQALKKKPKKDDLIVLLGGDNYRIGMGGAAVSSANTGSFENTIELNAVQRSNPEMQKRVANTIRALVETGNNPIVSIHDHGAGGHLNCFSELVEENGGTISLENLPIGDPTLSAKEIIGNESQERMGLIIAPEDLPLIEKIAARERAPLYVVGTVRDDQQFTIVDNKKNLKPIDLSLDAFFGSAPTTIMSDKTSSIEFSPIDYDLNQISNYLEKVLQIESVACKDWLTNKVDRCVTGRVAQQQTVGSLQLPLSNCGVIALDFKSHKGIATALGHAPIVALIDAGKGSQLAIAESLTNLIWAPLEDGLASVSLSANWMWPCNNPGEDARLYQAVEACSDFAIALGINIPTGKDSLSMKQQYTDTTVIAPGTVIISAAGVCSDIRKIITPAIDHDGGALFYIDLSREGLVIGGTAFAQTQSKIGNKAAGINDPIYFKKVFEFIQNLIKEKEITAGHDISSGGMLVTLLEMAFPNPNISLTLDLRVIDCLDDVHLFFTENSGLIIQSKMALDELAKRNGINCLKIGDVTHGKTMNVSTSNGNYLFDIPKHRDFWYSTSTLLDAQQTNGDLAQQRLQNYAKQPLKFKFPTSFTGRLASAVKHPKIKAAVIREQGSNSEREMSNALHLAGFEVVDVHMTDLITGRTDLEDFHFLAAVGGFSNSDVLGSAKGWAGSFKFNEKARTSLEAFFKRKDTLSLGVCNGCQLFISLGLLTPEDEEKPTMNHNNSKKFECQFTAVTINDSPAIMLKNLVGTTLGIWAAHGEGKFVFPYKESEYYIPAKYHHSSYPANPNGSQYNAAMLTSKDGRHLVMMPHLERSTFPWNWAHYPSDQNDEVSPWMLAFESAFSWLASKQ